MTTKFYIVQSINIDWNTGRFYAFLNRIVDNDGYIGVIYNIRVDNIHHLDSDAVIFYSDCNFDIDMSLPFNDVLDGAIANLSPLKA